MQSTSERVYIITTSERVEYPLTPPEGSWRKMKIISFVPNGKNTNLKRFTIMEKINLTTTKKVKKVAYIKSNNRAKREIRVQDTHYFDFAFNTVIMCNELNYGM